MSYPYHDRFPTDPFASDLPATMRPPPPTASTEQRLDSMAYPYHDRSPMTRVAPGVPSPPTASPEQRLECLRLITKQQKILDRLAGLTDRESIPDELVAHIFGFLAQDIGVVQSLVIDPATGEPNTFYQEILGASTAARLLSGRLEEQLMKHTKHTIISIDSNQLINYKNLPALQARLRQIHHLQIEFHLTPDSTSFNMTGQIRIREALRLITERADTCFPKLESLTVQPILYEPSENGSLSANIISSTANDGQLRSDYQFYVSEMLKSMLLVNGHRILDKKSKLLLYFQACSIHVQPSSSYLMKAVEESVTLRGKRWQFKPEAGFEWCHEIRRLLGTGVLL